MGNASCCGLCRRRQRGGEGHGESPNRSGYGTYEEHLNELLAADEILDIVAGDAQREHGYPVEITVHLDHLPAHRHNAYVVAAEELPSGEIEHLGRTETAHHNASPQFIAPVVVKHLHHRDKTIVLKVYDASHADNGAHLVGTVRVSLNSLCAAGHVAADVMRDGDKRVSAHGQHTTMTLYAQRITNLQELVTLELGGVDLGGAGGASRVHHPFVVVNRVQGKKMIPVAKTAPAASTRSPQWPPLFVKGYRLCCNDDDAPLQLAVYSSVPKGHHVYLGSARATLAALMSGCYAALPLTNEARIGGKKYTGSGHLVVRKVSRSAPHTFAEYVDAGLEIKATLLIDFSKSNMLLSKSATGLHFVPSDAFASSHLTPPESEYAVAIRAICESVAQVTHQRFAAYGFGAVPKEQNDEAGACERLKREMFKLGLGATAEFDSVDAILEAYHATLRKVELTEPTVLGQALRQFIDKHEEISDAVYDSSSSEDDEPIGAAVNGGGGAAGKKATRGSVKGPRLNPRHPQAAHYHHPLLHNRGVYHVLYILTDGGIDDMTEVVDTIVDVSPAPVSVVVVGVGNPETQREEFAKMEALRSRNRSLITGKHQQRENVFFVPLEAFRHEQRSSALQRETLAVVAQQFLTWAERTEFGIEVLPKFHGMLRVDELHQRHKHSNHPAHHHHNLTVQRKRQHPPTPPPQADERRIAAEAEAAIADAAAFAGGGERDRPRHLLPPIHHASSARALDTTSASQYHNHDHDHDGRGGYGGGYGVLPPTADPLTHPYPSPYSGGGRTEHAGQGSKLPPPFGPIAVGGGGGGGATAATRDGDVLREGQDEADGMLMSPARPPLYPVAPGGGESVGGGGGGYGPRPITPPAKSPAYRPDDGLAGLAGPAGSISLPDPRAGAVRGRQSPRAAPPTPPPPPAHSNGNTYSSRGSLVYAGAASPPAASPLGDVPTSPRTPGYLGADGVRTGAVLPRDYSAAAVSPPPAAGYPRALDTTMLHTRAVERHMLRAAHSETAAAVVEERQVDDPAQHVDVNGDPLGFAGHTTSHSSIPRYAHGHGAAATPVATATATGKTTVPTTQSYEPPPLPPPLPSPSPRTPGAVGGIHPSTWDTSTAPPSFAAAGPWGRGRVVEPMRKREVARGRGGRYRADI